MDRSESLNLALEDVLGDLWHARRRSDLGRLALLVHFDLRRWAVAAGNVLLAQRSRELVLNCPHTSKEDFLAEVDVLIAEAERIHDRAPAVSV